MDGKVVDMKDYEPGVTVPPFHVFCRSVTVPYFEDNFPGERAARNEDGNTYYVPDDMTYKEWKKSMVDSEESLLTNKENKGKIIMSTYVNSSDDLFTYAKKIKPLDGYEDIVIHGNKLGFEIRDHDGNSVANYTPREFAEILREDPNYHGGDIRLIACESGAEGAIAAQALANQLGVNILAPTDVVIVYSDGEMKIGYGGDGTWKLFRKE